MHAGRLWERYLQQRLQPGCGGSFVLFFGEGCNVSEVAAITGRDRKTVRKRLAEAKAAALRLLSQSGPRATDLSSAGQT